MRKKEQRFDEPAFLVPFAAWEQVLKESEVKLSLGGVECLKIPSCFSMAYAVYIENKLN